MCNFSSQRRDKYMELEFTNEETGETDVQELPTCAETGHKPTLVIADNGFTYESVCGRCGERTK